MSLLNDSMGRQYILLFFIASALAFAQQPGQEERYVGRAGAAYITEREFLERFELTPGLYRHRGTQLEEEKESFLISMIAEKLLAQEAVDRGWDGEGVAQDDLRQITKLLARDELYRLEVSSRVSVTPAEIRAGLHQARRLLLTRFFFFDSEQNADFVRSRLRSGHNIFDLRIDSSVAVVADTASVEWGEADTTIERAAYALKPGDVSPVLASGEGWYILQLVSSTTNLQYVGAAPDVQWERVAAKIRSRKERVREREYVEKVMGLSTAFSPPGNYRRFTENLGAVLAGHTRDSSGGITLSVKNELRSKCAATLQDTLVVAGTEIWTVDDVIDRLYRTSFSVPPSRLGHLPSILHATIREWVEQELLAQEALRRGFERNPEVARSIGLWRDYILAFAARGQIARNVRATDAEVYAFLHAGNPDFSVPRVRIRELRTASFEEMSSALAELGEGTPFSRVIERWSIDPRARTSGGLTDFFAITDRPSIGEIAWQLSLGEQYGPVRDSTGVVLFEVVAKDSGNALETKDAAAKFAEARAELLRMKQKRALNLFLASAGEARGFEIYDERLRQLSASPIPMLAYRFLGFGGRMFAVPFVDRNLDWISVEPPAEKVVP